MNKRKTGALYEQRAAAFLRGRGYRILEQNYRCRAGEIDLIARDGRYLVFVEVKYRHDGRLGEGVCAVDWRKQRRISRTALWYLAEHRLGAETPCRFDVVSVDGERVTLVQDAFSFAG